MRLFTVSLAVAGGLLLPMRTGQIAARSQQPDTPSARNGAMMVYDSGHTEMLLFGGEAPADSGRGMEFPDDLWAWNGRSWRQLHPAAGTPRPRGREVPHLVFDDARKRLVMFGGRRRPDRLFDTWEWDGKRWHEKLDTALDRVLHAGTVFASRRRRVTMFGGGREQGPPAHALSEWDGHRWAQRDTSGPQNVLAMASMEMPGGDLLLLTRPIPTVKPETRSWIWNGASWREAEAGPALPENQPFAATADGFLYVYQSWDRVISDPIMHRRDPRGAWTTIPMRTHPGVRSTSATGWDPGRRRMVLFGGRTRESRYLNDTWEWNGETWQRVDALPP